MFFFGTTFLPHIVVWLGDIGFFEEQPKKALICYNTCTDLLELVRNNQTLVLLSVGFIVQQPKEADVPV